MPPLFFLRDKNGKDLPQGFYEKELKLTPSSKPTVKSIGKEVKVINGEPHRFVTYKNYPKRWDIENIVLLFLIEK